MAIIKPSKKFTGSEIDLRDAGKYIRSDVRQVTFSKRNNPNGAYLYFLPPYKADAEGNGVWYRKVQIRDNFGDKFKEKYVCINNDPVSHFERNLRVLYPDLAAIKEGVDERGQSRKVYPLCGRLANRVLYNVAYLNQLELGAHILDLPAYNGASIIDNWLKEKDTRGRERPLLCDPESCIPVFIKLRDGGGAPWQIEPSAAEAAVIPDALADSDNLYNLDDVFVVKTPQELIAKLRECYANDVFESCMEGYPGFMSNSELERPVFQPKRPAKSATAAAFAAVAAATTTAAAVAGIGSSFAKTAIQEDVEKEYVDDEIDMSPSPAKPKVSQDAAMAFLSRPKPRIAG